MNPAREYRALQSEIRTIIEKLPETLNSHVARQEQHPDHWSFVEDLKHVRIELLRLSAFLGDEGARETLHVEQVDR